MQPPPRKVKPSIQLKLVHTEQLAKLQQKQQQDSELLEDIRQFSKQRSIIEKEYAQSLQKLSQQYLTKREFKEPPDITAEDGLEHLKKGRTVLTVWKTILEETKHVAEARLLAADTYMSQISKPLGPLKNSKTAISKKVLDHTTVLQKDLSQAVQDMVKSWKVYNDEEHLAHEARVKATEAEEKVKNKSTGIFTSLSTLQRSSAKLCSRREQCEVKATASRNEYLLSLAAANANHARFLNTDLSDLIKIMDGEMYEHIKEYFSAFGKAELECCGTTQECFTKILHDAHLISGNYNQFCFLKENIAFNSLLQYSFQPMDNDKVTELRGDHGATPQLNKEAHKWATKVAKDNKVIQDKTRILQAAQANGSRKPSESSQDGNNSTEGDSNDLKVEDARQILRRAETSRLKAEARLELLRKCGVNVDEIVATVQAETQAQTTEEGGHLSRHSSVSARSDSSGGGQKESVAHDESQNSADVPNDSTYINYDDYDDEFVDEAYDTSGNVVGLETSSGYSSGRMYPLKSVALYDFQANNADELTLKEGEHLELVADGDGDGWVRARNLDGNTGFIPENYIQILDDNSVSSPTVDQISDTASTEVVPQENLTNSIAETNSLQNSECVSSYSSNDYEVQAATVPQDLPILTGSYILASSSEDVWSDLEDLLYNKGIWARAMYDYEATAEEELTFHEGQLIKVIRKDENGVDDGWWEGEVNGRVGVFPSLVVEELSQEGMAGQDMTSPVQGGPPPFTPPAPGPPPPYLDLMQCPPHVEITQPTPEHESPNLPQIAVSSPVSGGPNEGAEPASVTDSSADVSCDVPTSGNQTADTQEGATEQTSHDNVQDGQSGSNQCKSSIHFSTPNDYKYSLDDNESSI